MNLVGIVGTNTIKSDNRLLLMYMQQHFGDEADLETIETLNAPLFDSEHDQTEGPIISDFTEAIMAADGVIVAAPDANLAVPAQLKSLLEWLSFKVHPLDRKPVMIASVCETAAGSLCVQEELRDILSAPGVNAALMANDDFLLTNSEAVFDEQGNLFDAETISRLETNFMHFKRFAEVNNALNVPKEVTFTPGTFTVTTPGHSGDLPMTVTLSEHRIEKIEIDTTQEMDDPNDIVFQEIPMKIVTGQTLNVDAISGATETSNGVVEGVAEVVKRAGANPDYLRMRQRK
ncbi:NAD(P)H-dependent oxidoreductase [Lapidilactobacillus bayanensis]|uniref:NAD(P)H-dependent oxidoreductase n=1 Tax=Lapidilactobacillus bayanensis TaxID=2485998 RepID=UPI000F771246|nr:NAD(P)H-dependent oxidoreductase [Lapidilactobacillus bayanensis]